MYVKNVHPVYSAGIPTNVHWNMSLLPGPLDQGSRPQHKMNLIQSLFILLMVFLA